MTRQDPAPQTPRQPDYWERSWATPPYSRQALPENPEPHLEMGGYPAIQSGRKLVPVVPRFQDVLDLLADLGANGPLQPDADGNLYLKDEKTGEYYTFNREKLEVEQIHPRRLPDDGEDIIIENGESIAMAEIHPDFRVGIISLAEGQLADLSLLFRDLDDALQFFSSPYNIGEELRKRNDGNFYLQEEGTDKLYRFNPEKFELEEITPDQLPPSGIDGVFLPKEGIQLSELVEGAKQRMAQVEQTLAENSQWQENSRRVSNSVWDKSSQTFRGPEKIYKAQTREEFIERATENGVSQSAASSAYQKIEDFKNAEFMIPFSPEENAAIVLNYSNIQEPSRIIATPKIPIEVIMSALVPTHISPGMNGVARLAIAGLQSFPVFIVPDGGINDESIDREGQRVPETSETLSYFDAIGITNPNSGAGIVAGAIVMTESDYANNPGLLFHEAIHAGMLAARAQYYDFAQRALVNPYDPDTQTKLDNMDRFIDAMEVVENTLPVIIEQSIRSRENVQGQEEYLGNGEEFAAQFYAGVMADTLVQMGLPTENPESFENLSHLLNDLIYESVGLNPRTVDSVTEAGIDLMISSAYATYMMDEDLNIALQSLAEIAETRSGLNLNSPLNDWELKEEMRRHFANERTWTQMVRRGVESILKKGTGSD